MSIPQDYAERVYAGVLGKLIGVYLGRPIESWTYERITAEIGEVDRFLPGRDGAPLVVTDDDVTGTFTFLRALEDHEAGRHLTPRQVGETWLNYTIEGRTIFWWGGLGNSTEHTAYLRLKRGVPAPESGSIATNGKIVAEQIGAQIFVDGWGMVAPGDPAFAADLARQAASVSHDGEAIYGARMVAAMEAQAFVESDINRLIDTGLALIPDDTVISRMIADVREWHARDGDWRRTRDRIAERYGYDTYRGACHIVPNHALIILSLLYGEDDFRRSLMIVNTCGWDTDCNSGNLGCLLGIKNGVPGIDHGDVDWRGPIADRMYLSTADGGRAISDAVTETFRIVSANRALCGSKSAPPKGGARFHFALPGSVQGFEVDPDNAGKTHIENTTDGNGGRRLSIQMRHSARNGFARVATPTFIPPEAITMPGYALLASPTLYAGQRLEARLGADPRNDEPLTCRLFYRVYDEEDTSVVHDGLAVELAPGSRTTLTRIVPDTHGLPIHAIGLACGPASGAGGWTGTVHLDSLTWSGAPDVTLGRPNGSGQMWRRAWVDGVDQFQGYWAEPYRVVQNEGVGIVSQGTREWRDYRAAASFTAHLARSSGIAVRVQGLRRYYALLLSECGVARLVKALDGVSTLAEAPFARAIESAYTLELVVEGNRIRAMVDDEAIFALEDHERPLMGGGVGIVCEEGCVSVGPVRVQPLD